MPRVFRGTPEGKFVDATKELGLDEPTLVMGSQLRRSEQRRLARHVPGHGQPGLQDDHTEQAVPESRGAAVCRRERSGRHGPFAEGARRGVRRSRRRRRSRRVHADGRCLPRRQVSSTPCSRTPASATTLLSVELVGVESNRFGVGSRIRVDVEEDGQTRSIYRWVNSGGSFGCNSLRQQIGVGKATRVKRLEVFWPKSNETQVFEDLPTNGIIRVTEGAKEYVETNLRPTEFARRGLRSEHYRLFANHSS